MSLKLLNHHEFDRLKFSCFIFKRGTTRAIDFYDVNVLLNPLHSITSRSTSYIELLYTLSMFAKLMTL